MIPIGALQMLGSRLMVELAPQITRVGAIHLPTTSRAQDVLGTVVACAPNVREVSLGDVVIFPESAGRPPLTTGQSRYLILDEDEVLAVWEATYEH